MAPEQPKESWIHRAASNPHVKGGNISVLGSHLVAASSEFLGTFFFLWLGYGGQLMALTQAASPAGQGGGASSQTVVFISLIYSFSLLVNAWAFFGILRSLSGSVLPGSSLGSEPHSSCISQVNTLLSAETSTAKGLFIEMFMTAELVFVILMLAAEKSKDTFLAPIGIGLALFICELAGVFYTGGSLNPARSFGCAVAGKSFPGYHWIYWLGPVLGAALAALYYRFVKWAHYEEVNPGQDSAGAAEDANTEAV